MNGVTTPTDPMDAMGRAIPPAAKQEVIGTLVTEMGRDLTTAMVAVDQIAANLEQNEPERAFAACRVYLGSSDVTLHFRVIAELLARADGDAPQQRGGQGLEALAPEPQPAAVVERSKARTA